MTTQSSLAGALVVAIILLVLGMMRAAYTLVQGCRARSRLSAPQSGELPLAVWMWVGVAVIGVYLAVVAPQMLLVMTPVVLVARAIVNGALRERATRRYQSDLPVVLEQVAGGVRSGASLTMAIAGVGDEVSGPVAADLRRIGVEVRHGRSLEDALRNWSERSKLQSVRLVASSLILAHRTGAAHGRVIDSIVIGLRRALDAAELARTHATQSKSSAWALTALPVVFTGSMVLVDEQIRDFLFHSWWGTAVLASGLTLDGVGALWMAKLIRRAVEQ